MDLIQKRPQEEGAEGEDGPLAKKPRPDAAASGGNEVLDIPRPLMSTANMERARTSKESVAGADQNKSAPRSFQIQTLGSEGFPVSVPSDSTIGDLLAKISKERGLGLCFSLLTLEGQPLDDPSVPLPEDDKLQCVIENASQLCKSARRVLNNTPYVATQEDPGQLDSLRLGNCRKLGQRFSGSEWVEGHKDNGSGMELSDDEDAESLDQMQFQVYEFTLLDGDDKRLRLVGVICDGCADANTGCWGSVYLRPGLQEVGKIQSNGDCESIWLFENPLATARHWYTNPKTPLPDCEDAFHGGGDAFSRRTPLPIQTHFAHAFAEADNA